MAEQIGTDVPTLHRALTDLVCEGLITRTPRIGTHVAQWEKGLLRLGVYHSRNILADANAISHRVIEAEVQKLASQMKISVQVWTDPRPTTKQTEALPVLEHAARERIIQGLVSTDSDETHWKWFHKLPIPVAAIGCASASLIDFDHESFFDLAVDALRRQGCQTAAYLGPHVRESRFFDRFLAACAKGGLATRQEWIVRRDELGEGISYDEAGFHAFKRLWKNVEKPDGLIVYPDVYSSSIIMGILAEQVRVPQELKVVLHRNAEIKLFCPFEATFITSRFADAARAMIQQLDTALKGREPKRVSILHEAVKNPAA